MEQKIEKHKENLIDYIKYIKFGRDPRLEGFPQYHEKQIIEEDVNIRT